MKIDVIKKEVDTDSLIKHYVVRDGFVFKAITQPGNVYDAIVIQYPKDTPCSSPKLPSVRRSLQENIDLINKYKLEKAFIIAENIEFITQCPSLKYITIKPSDSAGNNFDYSPLYKIPQIKSLSCATVYGDKNEFTTSLDYSKVNGLEMVNISGSGHKNYNMLQGLRTMGISGCKEPDLTNMFGSPVLDSFMIIQCGIKSLEGLESAEKLQCLYLYHNRSLQDITALNKVKKTLKALRIDNCSKIEDFSVLTELENLEMLELCGNNTLPSLDFIKSMKSLKTLRFDMNVQDGDLSLCANIPCVRSLKHRKHYNLKDKDLPKGQAVYGNENIETWRRFN